jgi:hypothetical protein
MSGLTNRGRKLIFDGFFRRNGLVTTHYLALCTAAIVPDPDTNLLSDLTEITAGNGYTAGGQAVAPNTTDFDSMVENDTDDQSEIQLKDFSWTASGGPIPSAGGVPKYAVLLTDEATVANRQVIAFWDLGTVTAKSSGQTLTLADLEVDFKDIP